MNKFYFKDLIVSKQKVSSWQFIEVEVQPVVRIYFKLRIDKTNGFDFFIIENIGNDVVPDYREWDEAHTMVLVLFQGIAHFDGVRHLYMGDEQTDNKGYLLNMDINNLPAIFKELIELQNRFCNDFIKI